MKQTQKEQEYTRRYHATHREGRRLYAIQYRREHPEWKDAAKQRLIALKNGPCVDCGGTFPPECMDFDHRDWTEKKFNIGEHFYMREARLLEEVAKCDLVCANCHRIRTVKTKRLNAQRVRKLAV